MTTVKNRDQHGGGLIELAQNWTEAIDALESCHKRRVILLRSKLAQIVDVNSTNLDGANNILEKTLHAKYGDSDLPASAQTIQTLIKNGFNFDQEKLIT